MNFYKSSTQYKYRGWKWAAGCECQNKVKENHLIFSHVLKSIRAHTHTHRYKHSAETEQHEVLDWSCPDSLELSRRRLILHSWNNLHTDWTLTAQRVSVVFDTQKQVEGFCIKFNKLVTTHVPKEKNICRNAGKENMWRARGSVFYVFYQTVLSELRYVVVCSTNRSVLSNSVIFSLQILHCAVGESVFSLHPLLHPHLHPHLHCCL